jgi:hypothetical protein
LPISATIKPRPPGQARAGLRFEIRGRIPVFRKQAIRGAGIGSNVKKSPAEAGRVHPFGKVANSATHGPVGRLGHLRAGRHRRCWSKDERARHDLTTRFSITTNGSVDNASGRPWPTGGLIGGGTSLPWTASGRFMVDGQLLEGEEMEETQPKRANRLVGEAQSVTVMPHLFVSKINRLSHKI